MGIADCPRDAVDLAGRRRRRRFLRTGAKVVEPLAEPGGICISARVRDDAVGKFSFDVDDLGTLELKNIAQPIRVFRVPPRRAGCWKSAPTTVSGRRPQRITAAN